jgi:hypothetical protein
MPASRQGPGTVDALVCDYLKSPAFSNLKPASQRVYRASPPCTGIAWSATCRARRWRHTSTPSVPSGHQWRTSRRPCCVSSWHMASASDTETTTPSPKSTAIRAAPGTPGPRPSSRRSNTDGRWERGRGLLMPCYSAPGNGGGDVVKMRRADISGGAIAVVQQKTGTALSIPIHPDLVPRHSDYDWLILSQSRMGKSSGRTRIWMLLATPG